MILNLLEFTRMLSNEIPRSAELEDGSKASWPRRPCSSPSQRRQLDNFNYSDDGGLADRRCGSSAGPRPPRQCAELTSQSPSQKRSGAVAPTLVWGKGIICRNSPHFLACLPSRHAYCTSQPVLWLLDRAPQPTFAFELRNSASCLSQVNVMGDFVASLPDELNATSLHLLQPRQAAVGSFGAR